MVSITIENIVKTFGTVRAVDNLSLQIEKGELFFLLGPSGCGKTTLLRLIAGFEQPDSGRILFNEADVSHLPPHKRNAGMVFQNYALWPHMSVRENLTFGLEMHRVPSAERQERVQRALEMVQMCQYADRAPNQLSGRQQQRVALARALVLEPDMVLMDEPLSNLDAKLRLEMREQIKRIHDEMGLTMVYVTHDQSEALSMASRMVIMQDGHLIQIGTHSYTGQKPAGHRDHATTGRAGYHLGVRLRRRIFRDISRRTGQSDTAADLWVCHSPSALYGSSCLRRFSADQRYAGRSGAECRCQSRDDTPPNHHPSDFCQPCGGWNSLFLLRHARSERQPDSCRRRKVLSNHQGDLCPALTPGWGVYCQCLGRVGDGVAGNQSLSRR